MMKHYKLYCPYYSCYYYYYRLYHYSYGSCVLDLYYQHPNDVYDLLDHELDYFHYRNDIMVSISSIYPLIHHLSIFYCLDSNPSFSLSHYATLMAMLLINAMDPFETSSSSSGSSTNNLKDLKLSRGAFQGNLLNIIE